MLLCVTCNLMLDSLHDVQHKFVNMWLKTALCMIKWQSCTSRVTHVFRDFMFLCYCVGLQFHFTLRETQSKDFYTGLIYVILGVWEMMKMIMMELSGQQFGLSELYFPIIRNYLALAGNLTYTEQMVSLLVWPVWPGILLARWLFS